jgi:hypothetical protein
MAPSFKTTLNKINRTLENNVRIANKVIEENVRNVTKAAKKVPWLHVVIGVIAVGIILYCIWKLLRPKKGRKESFGSTTIAGVTVPDLTSQGRPTLKGRDIRIMSENDTNMGKFKDVMEHVGDGKTSIDKSDVDAQFNKFDGDKKPFAVTIFHDGAGKAVWVRKYALTSTDGVKPTEPLRSDPTNMEDQPNATVMYYHSEAVGEGGAVGAFDGIANFFGFGAQNPTSEAPAEPTWKAKVNIIINGDDMNTKTNGTEFMGKNMGESNCMKAVKAKGKDMVYGHHTTECWAKFINKGNFKNMTVTEENGNWTSASFDPQMKYGLPNINSLKSQIEQAKGTMATGTATPAAGTSNEEFDINSYSFYLQNVSMLDVYWIDRDWEFKAKAGENPTIWSTDGGDKLINVSGAARAYVNSNGNYVTMKNSGHNESDMKFRFDKVDGTTDQYYIMCIGFSSISAIAGGTWEKDGWKRASMGDLVKDNNQFKWKVVKFNKLQQGNASAPVDPVVSCGDGNRGNGKCQDPNACCSAYGWCGTQNQYKSNLNEEAKCKAPF